MKQWFLSLAPRERVLVAAAAVFIVAAVFYVAVWQPLHRNAARLEQQITVQRRLTADVAQLAAEASRLRAHTRRNIKATDVPLLSIIDQTSREAELAHAVQRIQPESEDKAAVTIDNASFDNMIRWLRQLQQQYGVAVTTLSVTRAEAEGAIDARIILERGA